MRPPVLVLALPLTLVLTACSGGDQKVATTGSPSPSVVPTTAAPTPTAVVSTPSPTASPTPAPKKAAIDGDVDGDGKPDAVKTTAERITVTLSTTGKQVTAPVHADSPAAPKVLGSKDVDRDGFAEVFVQTVQGASTAFATPYRFDGKVLRELQLDGQPALLGFGGSVQHGDGFRCTDRGLVEVRKAESSTGTSYTVSLAVYRMTATSLVRVRSSSGTAAQGSPEVEAAYTIDCGSVGEGE